MNYGEKSHVLKWSRTCCNKYNGTICAGSIGKLKGKEHVGLSWSMLNLEIRICFII